MFFEMWIMLNAMNLDIDMWDDQLEVKTQMYSNIANWYFALNKNKTVNSIGMYLDQLTLLTYEQMFIEIISIPYYCYILLKNWEK